MVFSLININFGVFPFSNWDRSRRWGYQWQPRAPRYKSVHSKTRPNVFCLYCGMAAKEVVNSILKLCLLCWHHWKNLGGRIEVSLHLFLNHFFRLQLSFKLSLITFRNGGMLSEYFCSLPFNRSVPESTIVSVAGGCSTVLGCLETLLQCKALQPLLHPSRASA